jgi:O-succinylbenzoic acid--CoA ligase
MTLSVFDAAEQTPAQSALVSGDRVYDYAELAERTRSRLRRLESCGLSRTDPRPVALIAAPATGSIEVLLALFAAQVPVLLLHQRSTELERAELLARCPAQLVVDGGSLELRPGTGTARALEDGERPLALVPTSATSGRPKLVMLSRRAFVHSAEASRQNLGSRAGDRWLLCLPLAHVGGLSILTRSLLARTAVVLAAPPSGSSSSDWLDALREDRVSLASLVPTQLARLLDHDPAWRPGPNLRAVLLGGAGAHAALVARAEARGVPLLPSYGLTEACSQVTTRRAAELGTPIRRHGAIVSSGRPLPGIEVRVIDGAIQVRGPNLCDGYFGEDPPKRSADGFLVTEDRGLLDEAGELFVLGRAGDRIVSGGENVDPLEVEAALCAVDGVAAACVFSVEDETWGERVAAVIVPAANGAPSDTEIARALDRTLARFKHPRWFAEAKELPLTPAGKPDRAGTRRLFAGKLRRRM